MNTFFRPAVALMSRLKYSKKLLLLGSIATLAVSILAYQLVTQSLSIKQFSQKELYGVEYINPLIKLMETAQKYRGYENAYLLGDRLPLNRQLQTDITWRHVTFLASVISHKFFAQ